MVLIAVVGAVLVLTGSGDAGASEVFLEEATYAGANPFTDSVARVSPVTAKPNTTGTAKPTGSTARTSGTTRGTTPGTTRGTAPATTTTLAPTATPPGPPTTPVGAPPGAIGTMGGGTPGLYGGTMNMGSCDPEKLVQFLEANADKGKAWSEALGIQPSEIRSFVAKLTSVVLRQDTRVTNHGFVNGKANPLQAVLQAGTAVLVDSFGKPVVKCYCGNPLTAPVPVKEVKYTGTQWSGFSPDKLVVVQAAPAPIEEFALTSPDGALFERPAGTDGAADAERSDAPDPGSTTSTQRSTTTTTEPPTTTTEAPTTTESTTTTAVFNRIPGVGVWELSGDYTISYPTVTGNSHWTATITVADDGTITGSGSGQSFGGGGCFTANRQKISDWTADISFSLTVSGRASDGSLSITPTASNIRLDALVYTPEVPGNSGCRSEANAGYTGYVTDQMATISISASDGATAPIPAKTAGTATLSG